MQPRRAPTLSTEQVAGEREAALGHGRGRTRQVHGGVRKGRGRGSRPPTWGSREELRSGSTPDGGRPKFKLGGRAGFWRGVRLCALGEKARRCRPTGQTARKRGAGSDTPGNGARGIGELKAGGSELWPLPSQTLSTGHAQAKGRAFPQPAPGYWALRPRGRPNAQPSTSQSFLPLQTFLMHPRPGRQWDVFQDLAPHGWGGVEWVCSTQRWLRIGGDFRIFSHFICMCSRLAKVSGTCSYLPRAECCRQALGIPLWRGKTAHSLTRLPSFQCTLMPLGIGEWAEWAAQELGGSNWSSFSLRGSGSKWEPCRQGLVTSGSWGGPSLAQAPLGVFPFLDCWSALREPCFSSPLLRR